MSKATDPRNGVTRWSDSCKENVMASLQRGTNLRCLAAKKFRRCKSLWEVIREGEKTK